MRGRERVRRRPKEYGRAEIGAVGPVSPSANRDGLQIIATNKNNGKTSTSTKYNATSTLHRTPSVNNSKSAKSQPQLLTCSNKPELNSALRQSLSLSLPTPPGFSNHFEEVRKAGFHGMIVRWGRRRMREGRRELGLFAGSGVGAGHGRREGRGGGRGGEGEAEVGVRE